jgi:hypothetical protein
MYVIRSLCTFVAAAVTSLACAGNSGSASPELVDPNSPVQVVVDNRGFSDATIYLVSGGLIKRVGLVTGTSSQQFEVPAGYIGTAGEVRLQAHQVGSAGWMTTDLMTVRPGGIIRFTVENSLRNSYYSVY